MLDEGTFEGMGRLWCGKVGKVQDGVDSYCFFLPNIHPCLVALSTLSFPGKTDLPNCLQRVIRPG